MSTTPSFELMIPPWLGRSRPRYLEEVRRQSSHPLPSGYRGFRAELLSMGSLLQHSDAEELEPPSCWQLNRDFQWLLSAAGVDSSTLDLEEWQKIYDAGRLILLNPENENISRTFRYNSARTKIIEHLRDLSRAEYKANKKILKRDFDLLVKMVNCMEPRGAVSENILRLEGETIVGWGNNIRWGGESIKTCGLKVLNSYHKESGDKHHRKVDLSRLIGGCTKGRHCYHCTFEIQRRFNALAPSADIDSVKVSFSELSRSGGYSLGNGDQSSPDTAYNPASIRSLRTRHLNVCNQGRTPQSSNVPATVASLDSGTGLSREERQRIRVLRSSIYSVGVKKNDSDKRRKQRCR